MKTRTAAPHPIAACAASNTAPIAALALRVTQADEKTRLIPSGQFNAPRGAMSGSGPWQLDAAGAQAIIALAAARSTDIPIDYEHQTLMAERNGLPAPAAGWIDPRSLEWRNDGLYGQVTWTAAAKAAIDADSYRYLSPVFPYDAETGAVLDLLHVALTNTPAIDTAITELAAARAGRGASEATPPKENTVDREKLIAKLGLANDATDEQIDTAIAALKAAQADAEAFRSALGATAAAKPEEAVAALKASSAAAPVDMAQFVPVAVYQETTQQLAALKANSNTAELEALITEGLVDGRIPGKATADWLRKKGLAACKAHLEGAPSIAALKATQTQGKQPEETQSNDGALTDAELAVCKAAGLTPEQYREANPA
ncbi:phage protease [Halomonas sp. M1]|uniref:phage protease n=1 Tax=Halomonas sp. M1 TaxID=3035470 RepID=UPI0024862478|nr:phage protease [Halomonas sp. M1]WFE70125.1 phage protease [Halomonas sp. M1]